MTKENAKRCREIGIIMGIVLLMMLMGCEPIPEVTVDETVTWSSTTCNWIKAPEPNTVGLYYAENWTPAPQDTWNF